MKSSMLAAGAAAAILGVAVPGSAALAAGAATTTGTAKVWVTPSATTTSAKHPGKVLFTGVIGDYGTSQTVTATGKATRKSTYKLLKLKKGTITVSTAQFTKALTSASPSTASQSNCSFVVSATAPVTIVKGTGAYAGITGKLTLTGTFAAVLPKAKSGACTTKGKPLSSYISIAGSGTVSF